MPLYLFAVFVPFGDIFSFENFAFFLYGIILCFYSTNFFPFGNLFPIIYISTKGFVISPVKLLHVLITVFFGNAGQSGFKNLNFLILAVNPALQFAFLGKPRKSFQIVTLKFPRITFLFRLKMISFCRFSSL